MSSHLSARIFWIRSEQVYRLLTKEFHSVVSYKAIKCIGFKQIASIKWLHRICENPLTLQNCFLSRQTVWGGAEWTLNGKAAIIFTTMCWQEIKQFLLYSIFSIYTSTHVTHALFSGPAASKTRHHKILSLYTTWE